MDRRAFLVSVAGTAGVGLAGCSELRSESTADPSQDDDDDENEETPADESATAPEWARWLPAEALADGTSAEVGTLDPTATAAFPSEFDIGEPYRQIVRSLNVSPSNVDRAGIVLRDNGPEPGVITGSFDPAEIQEHIESESEEPVTVEEYNGVPIVNDFIGLDESALVMGDTIRTPIDVYYGSTPSLAGQRDVFEPLNSHLGGAPFAVLTDGYYDEPWDYDVDASGVAIEDLTEQEATLGIALLFESTGEAERFSEEGRQELAASDETISISTFDREGRFVTVTARTDDVSDFLSGNTRV